jgi:hypothetical protein
MPLPPKRSHGRTVCCLLCLSVNLCLTSVAAAQPTVNGSRDTTRTGKRPRYFSCTVLSGGAVQFFEKRTGLFSVSFPYSTVDGSGAAASATFSAHQKNIFGSASAFVGPLAFEMGRLHDFVHLELSFLLGKGTSAPGWKTFIGYGRICYTGRFAIKFSVNLSLASDPRQGGDLLGDIDNKNKTIYIFGSEVPPTFMSSNQTYNANTLEVTYSQREWSFMPEVSLLPNPYRKPNHFELSLGYTLPIHDYGGLNFIQQGYSPSKGTVSSLIAGPNILNNAISVSYDNKPLKSPLYRFGGFYLELRFDVIEGWKKKKLRPSLLRP